MSEVERYIQLALPKPQKILTPAVVTILILIVIGYALANYAKDFTMANLALNCESVFEGKVWVLLTYPFINCCPGNLFWNSLVILFVGSAIEREWKMKSLAILWLIVSVVCGVIWVAVSYIRGANFIGFGTSAPCFGLIATFGILFRGKRFLFWLWPIEAQHIAWILIIAGLVMGIAQLQSWVFVGGSLVAYLYVKLRLRMSSGISKQTSRFKQNKPSGFVDID